MTWLEIVEEAFGTTERELHLSEIYIRCNKVIEEKCPEKLTNKQNEATIRQALEANSRDSANFRGNNRFHLTRGKGKGYWEMI